MRYRSFIALWIVALAGSTAAAGAHQEPLSWQRATIQTPFAWHTKKDTAVFAATLQLPNACYRAKVRRIQSAGPNSPAVFEVVQGQIAGTMCAQMIVECSVLGEPESTTKNYVIAKDRRGTRKVRISEARFKLPETCPA